MPQWINCRILARIWRRSPQCRPSRLAATGPAPWQGPWPGPRPLRTPTEPTPSLILSARPRTHGAPSGHGLGRGGAGTIAAPFTAGPAPTPRQRMNEVRTGGGGGGTMRCSGVKRGCAAQCQCSGHHGSRGGAGRHIATPALLQRARSPTRPRARPPRPAPTERKLWRGLRYRSAQKYVVLGTADRGGARRGAT